MDGKFPGSSLDESVIELQAEYQQRLEQHRIELQAEYRQRFDQLLAEHRLEKAEYQQRLHQLFEEGSADAGSALPEERGSGENFDLRVEPETFLVPSLDLTLAMLNATREDLGHGKDAEARLAEMAADLRDELLGTIAQFALAALDRGEKRVELSQGELLGGDFVSDLMRNLPIDPYGAAEALKRLRSELLAAAKNQTLSAGWGRLVAAPDGNIELVLSQTAGHSDTLAATTTRADL